MDCTLVFVYIIKNESKAIIGRLGDSAICVFGENDSIALNDGNKSANGTYEQFILTDDGLTSIGTTEINLSDYATKDEVEKSNVKYSQNSRIITQNNHGVTLNKLGYTDVNGNLTNNAAEAQGDYITLASESAGFNKTTKTFNKPNYFVTGDETENYITTKVAELQDIGVDYQIVSNLEEITSPKKGVIYLVPNKSASGAFNGSYEEYLYNPE
jgi:hypothetical protein